MTTTTTNPSRKATDAARRLSALVTVDPTTAAKEILDAVEKARGVFPDACTALGCSLSAFYKWVELLGIGEKAEGLRSSLKAATRAAKAAKKPKTKRVRSRKKAAPAAVSAEA